MKKSEILIILILMVLAAVGIVSLVANLTPEPHTCPFPPLRQLQEPTFEDLRDAIEWIESRGNRYAIGPGGERGVLQLSEIYIDDVNRIRGPSVVNGKPIYQYIEAFSPLFSRVMFRTYTEYYLDIAASQEPNMSTFELIARIHNGGPNGWKKESTKPYWLLIKARLERK